MNNRGIITQLRAVGAEANDCFDALNEGGCAVYAALVARALLNRGIPARGRVADRYNLGKNTVSVVRELLGQQGIDTARANARDWNVKGIDFTHVLVEFDYRGKTYLCDSNFVDSKPREIEPTCGAPLLPGSLSIAELEAIAADECGWNPWFDRDNIPALQQIISATLGAGGNE